MPYGMVRAHLEEMPSIQAAENLSALQVGLICSGRTMTDRAAERAQERWEELAGVGKESRRQMTREEILAMARKMRMRVNARRK